MGNLYNELFSEHVGSQALLKIIGLKEDSIPRYRTCYFNGTHIVLHTRTGGDNRKFYASEESCRKNHPECFTGEIDDPVGPWNSDLVKSPHYSHDEDEAIDNTYANFYFNVPEGITLTEIGKPPGEQWATLFKKLKVKGYE